MPDVILESSPERSNLIKESLPSYGFTPILCVNRSLQPRGHTSPFVLNVRLKDMSFESDHIIFKSSDVIRLGELSFSCSGKHRAYNVLKCYSPYSYGSNLQESFIQWCSYSTPQVVPYFNQEHEAEFKEFYSLYPTDVFIGRRKVRAELSDILSRARANFLSIEKNQEKIGPDFIERFKIIQNINSNCLTSSLFLSGMINLPEADIDVYDMGPYLKQCEVVHSPRPRDLVVWQDKGAISGGKLHTPHAGVVVNSDPLLVCNRSSPESPLRYESVESAGRDYQNHSLVFYRPRPE